MRFLLNHCYVYCLKKKKQDHRVSSNNHVFLLFQSDTCTCLYRLKIQSLITREIHRRKRINSISHRDIYLLGKQIVRG